MATATLALTACAGGSGSAAQSGATAQDASASSRARSPTTRAAGHPARHNHRVAIDQIPIESTYLAYFDGRLPGGHERPRQGDEPDDREMAPEMMQVDTSYYDKGELNAEALLVLNVDVVFYNAFNKEHAEMFRKAVSAR